MPCHISASPLRHRRKIRPPDQVQDHHEEVASADEADQAAGSTVEGQDPLEPACPRASGRWPRCAGVSLAVRPLPDRPARAPTITTNGSMADPSEDDPSA